jgi:hypothetical protein
MIDKWGFDQLILKYGAAVVEGDGHFSAFEDLFEAACDKYGVVRATHVEKAIEPGGITCPDCFKTPKYEIILEGMLEAERRQVKALQEQLTAKNREIDEKDKQIKNLEKKAMNQLGRLWR